jgi:beta-glucosidase
VVFAWSRRAPAFALAGDQDRLIEDVAAVNPNTIVVLNTSQPVALPWAAKVKAILQMWWPGDEGGWATAKLLLGRANPSGRLPVTWAGALEDYPAGDPRHPERSSQGVGGKTTFSEGLDVGYRWFDRQDVAPLYPFGHGLSYTTFAYSDLKVAKAPDGGLDVRVAIRNTGRAAGDEVPQVYLGAPTSGPAGVAFPVRKLVAFARVSLAAGQARKIRLRVPLRQLQSWSSTEHRWVKPPGTRTISVGASSRDLRVRTEIDLGQ